MAWLETMGASLLASFENCLLSEVDGLRRRAIGVVGDSLIPNDARSLVERAVLFGPDDGHLHGKSRRERGAQPVQMEGLGE